MSTDTKPAVIIDNGSYWIRAGPSGDDAPQITFPTCVGYPLEVHLSTVYYYSQHLPFWPAAIGPCH